MKRKRYSVSHHSLSAEMNRLLLHYTLDQHLALYLDLLFIAVPPELPAKQ